ncbi:MAG: hypothetical protein GSR80_000617 [Desulfurococcales archaeon]|nr:hypothetical protein [Desulfurococcales archaeon]
MRGEYLHPDEELLGAVDEFSRAVELLAGLLYQAARLARREDVAKAVEGIVRCYAAQDPLVRAWSCGDCEYYDPAGRGACYERCEKERSRAIDSTARAILEGVTG